MRALSIVRAMSRVVASLVLIFTLRLLLVSRRPAAHHEVHAERTRKQRQQREKGSGRTEQGTATAGEDDEDQKRRAAADGHLERHLPVPGLCGPVRALDLGATRDGSLDPNRPHAFDELLGMRVGAEDLAEALRRALLTGFRAAERAVPRLACRLDRWRPVPGSDRHHREFDSLSVAFPRWVSHVRSSSSVSIHAFTPPFGHYFTLIRYSFTVRACPPHTSASALNPRASAAEAAAAAAPGREPPPASSGLASLSRTPRRAPPSRPIRRSGRTSAPPPASHRSG